MTLVERVYPRTRAFGTQTPRTHPGIWEPETKSQIRSCYPA